MPSPTSPLACTLALALLACTPSPSEAPAVVAAPPVTATAPSEPLVLSPNAVPLTPPSAPAGAPFVSTCTGVVLDLALAPSVPDGVGIPVAVSLRNTGSAPVSLMLTGDGSVAERRNPTLTFELTPNKTEPPALCGMINGLSEDDFATLQPGARVKLEWLYAPTPSASGRYTLEATYRNDPSGDPMRGHGATPPVLLAKARRTVACEVTSAPLTVDWNSATHTATLVP